MDAMEGRTSKIILYDGVCNLCDGAIRFVLPRDKAGEFRYAALQSDYAKSILARHAIAESEALESLILIENDRPYLYSSGVLRIARSLPFPWSLAAIFLVVPRFVRDGIYRWVARNRYRWFGKQESCLLPKPEWRDRFLG